MQKIVCIGLGYIGLPTATMVAEKGLDVLGVDINTRVVDTINKGAIHIAEPGLETLVREVVQRGNLRVAVKPEAGDVFLIVVPTPFKGNHEPDITYVEAATRSVLPFLKTGNLFIIESTSPIGTTEKMQQLIYSERPELKDKIYVAYCPERVLPGNLLYELEYNDRVIGGIDEASTVRAMEFYALLVKGQLHKTN
ncbi:MAG: UDP-N-acetyl-D-mannosamine dehydrogenase, partial [Prevotellaceae bacterium]|nr:UDP-N-acetyl-D-mannosamine dehydrogenase [Prevotellaceae bacterium]